MMNVTNNVAARLMRELDKQAQEGLDEISLRKAIETICVSTKHYSVGTHWILNNFNIFAKLNFSLRELILSYKETEHAANAFMCDARILMLLHSEERLPFIEFAYQHFGLPNTDNPISLVHTMLDSGISPEEIVDMFGRLIETSSPKANKLYPANDFLRILSSRHGESYLGTWLMSPKDFTKKAGREKIQKVILKAIKNNPNFLLQFPIIMKRFLSQSEYTNLLNAEIQNMTTLRFVSLQTIQELKPQTLLRLILRLYDKGWETNFEIYSQSCTRILLEIPDEFLFRCWNILEPIYASKNAMRSLQFSKKILKTAKNQNRAIWIRRGLEIDSEAIKSKSKISTKIADSIKRPKHILSNA